MVGVDRFGWPENRYEIDAELDKELSEYGGILCSFDYDKDIYTDLGEFNFYDFRPKAVKRFLEGVMIASGGVGAIGGTALSLEEAENIYETDLDIEVRDDGSVERSNDSKFNRRNFLKGAAPAILGPLVFSRTEAFYNMLDAEDNNGWDALDKADYGLSDYMTLLRADAAESIQRDDSLSGLVVPVAAEELPDLKAYLEDPELRQRRMNEYGPLNDVLGASVVRYQNRDYPDL